MTAAGMPEERFGPPSERARALVAGGYDTHVHIAPDVLRRRIDDLALARRFGQVGLAGFVLKSHYVPTAERAGVVRAAVPGVAAGFSDDEVRTMAVDNTRRLALPDAG